MTIKALITGVSLVGATGLAIAQDSSRTELSGFIDVYYAYSSIQPHTRDRGFTTQPLRHNETNINLAYLSLKHEGESIRGRFAVQTGTYVEANTAAEPPLLKSILEASVGAHWGKSIWIDAGIFPSHIGLEGIASKDNWTYSRSILADYSPYYESGVSVTASLSDHLSLRGLILNGWQNIHETNNSKAVGTQVQYHPAEDMVLNWSTFVGNEAPDSSASQLRFMSDFSTQITVSPTWAVAAVIDIGAQRRASGSVFDIWHAASIMTKYSMNSRWAAAARIEYYIDRNGVIVSTGTANDFQVFSSSVNIDFAPAPPMLWRLEIRQFFSKDPLYPGKSGLQRAETCCVISAAITL